MVSDTVQLEGEVGVREEVGLKCDHEKIRLDLLPPKPLFEIAQVLTYGTHKYSAWNWSKGIAFSRLFAAMLGHIWAWWAGEDNDSDTGYSHLAHAGCCLLFIMELRHTKPDCDDRFKSLTKVQR